MECERADRHADSARPLNLAFFLTASYFLVELIGGFWTGSLALLADALHMGVDLVALGVSLWAARVSLRPPDKKRTFGYQRVEVLAALGNSVWLLVATGIILHAAYGRFFSPSEIKAKEMLGIAVVGLLCNLVAGFALFKGSHENLNVRGAFIHVMADALGSVGAIVAGLVIVFTGWSKADPLASAFICAGIIATSLWLLRDSVHILLEGAPAHLDLEEIRSALSSLGGVKEVHDLHLWSLTKGSESLSGHLVVETGCDIAAVLKSGKDLLAARFSISHVTLQIES